MLINIGSKKKAEDVVDRLLECHERIRFFAALACRMGQLPDIPETDAEKAAADVVRYFEHALPLHTRDEEESLLPLLRGKSSELDAALELMASEHRSHEEPLERLLVFMREIRHHPDRQPQLAESIAEVAIPLQKELLRHLDEEERLVFPAVRALLAEPQKALIEQQMAERRRD